MVEKGTVQGSVLGPTLFAIYIRPLFDILPILQFADDGYVSRGGENWKKLLEEDLDKAYKWLTGSGMVINEEKTEFVVFANKSESEPLVKLNNKHIDAKTEMKVLGVCFDNKLNWSTQVDKAILKMHKLSGTMKYLRKYFTEDELTIILKGQLLSSVYYNSEVWLIPTLHAMMKRRLLSASAGLIKATYGLHEWHISNRDLHELGGLPTPEQWSKYVTARTLHSILNTQRPDDIYNALALQARYESRTNRMYFGENNNKRVGRNCFQNRCDLVSKKLGTINWTANWSALKNSVKSSLWLKQ